MMKIPDSVQVFVISDTHWNHLNIIQYSSRPFKSVEEMNEAMIRNWQSAVRDDDLVFHLGDWFMGAKHLAAPIMKRLTGRKILVRGNHDKMFKGYPELDSQLESAHDYLEVAHRGDCAVLSHFPIEVWNQAHKGFWHLHGHSHGTSRPVGRRLDVGVDAFCNAYMPRRWQDVAKHMESQIYMAGDHHNETHES
jgi:calcineurin-like phosphoesterase family protein